MTFSAIIQRQTLADFSETFGSVVDEVVLSFTDDGLHGAAVDPANVARVEQTLSPSAFDHYETTGIRTGVALEKTRLLPLQIQRRPRIRRIRRGDTPLRMGVRARPIQYGVHRPRRDSGWRRRPRD